MHQPTFNIKGLNDQDEDMMLGMGVGGQSIMKTKDKYTKYLKLLIEIASLQTQYITTQRVIKVTNRRVNALEFVVIPRIETTIKWIESELDELDREDFYRLKCVQDKKMELKDLEEKEKEEREAKTKGTENRTEDEKNQDDLFQAQDNENDALHDDDSDEIIF